MGEIAEMMIDGTLCQGCGVLLAADGVPLGYPGFCADCSKENPPQQELKSAHNQPVKDFIVNLLITESEHDIIRLVRGLQAGHVDVSGLNQICVHCRVCNKSFKSEQSLLQHCDATGHRK